MLMAQAILYLDENTVAVPDLVNNLNYDYIYIYIYLYQVQIPEKNIVG